MQISELSTLLRQVADAIDTVSEPATDGSATPSPAPAEAPEAPETQAGTVTAMFAQPPVQEAPAQVAPAVTANDVVTVFQSLCEKLGQPEGTTRIIETLRALGINRVSEANEGQLQTLFAKATEEISNAA
jgi:hypothetical protein